MDSSKYHSTSLHKNPLGKYSLQFEFAGTSLLKGNTMVQEVWVVSRTYLSVVSVDPNLRQSGDRWDFTAPSGG